MKMNRLTKVFDNNQPLVNIYFTAGYPQLNDTIEIAKLLYKNGVNMIEIGMPYSDPLADGETIQQSSKRALQNGMHLKLLFKQITEIRRHNNNLVIVLMGYYNQILQVGIDRFLQYAKSAGIDAMIIPDLPLDIYLESYKVKFEEYDIKISFLITPQTTEERIIQISHACTGFLYVVSTYATTGNSLSLNRVNIDYFNRIKEMNLPIPQLIGFGINDKESFQKASEYAHGAIIGSAFIKALTKQSDDLPKAIHQFITSIL